MNARWRSPGTRWARSPRWSRRESLSEQHGARLVVARGRLMDEAARATAGGMLVVKGGPLDVAPALAETGIALANHNAPRQVVLSGSSSQVAAAERVLADAGVRSRRLPVSGAFHSPLMQPAVARFRAVVDSVRFAAPRIPVISCITAAPLKRPVSAVVAALTQPVRWVDLMRALGALGVERFVETGPGTVLTGLARQNGA